MFTLTYKVFGKYPLKIVRDYCTIKIAALLVAKRPGKMFKSSGCAHKAFTRAHSRTWGRLASKG
jgi:hypothetical protein